jgi:hypothetical protein
MATAIIPTPRFPVTTRLATIDDLPFIDSLQKLHAKQVGWMPTKSLEAKLAAGQVLIAEEGRIQRAEGRIGPGSALSEPSSLCPHPSALGYIIGNDQYFKHDDIGIIYQLNVVPQRQRGLIGATLVKAMFERAAWGCRLFCCWCAQDIEANYFWESLGFIPLAFRAGSRSRGRKSEVTGQPIARVHIFWRRRIRAGDETTPYWFPSQTSGGSIREDRLVLPIPPGVHWRDAMPRVLPSDGSPKLEIRNSRQIRNQKSEIRNSRPANVPPGGLWFAPANPSEAAPKAKQKPPRATLKNDPTLVAAARELRDKYLEQYNSQGLLPTAQGKYDVSRLIAVPASIQRTPQLEAA